MGTVIEFRNVNKSYDDTKVLYDINLTIEEGECLGILGPSGSGKSTLLKLAAGIEPFDDGSIIRNDGLTAMVFQEAKLFPELTVSDNISFGLRYLGKSDQEIAESVEEISALVGVSELLQRYPSQLSGGQAQRVAIARALVRKPDICLWDEPLSNLDVKLKNQLRDEISDLHKMLSSTMIYVSHDQDEIMRIADRIAVIIDGRCLQVSTPDELYHQPSSMAVADFVGPLGMNWLSGYVKGNIMHIGNDTCELPDELCYLEQYGQIYIGIRPEHVVFTDQGKPFDLDKLVTIGDDSYAYGRYNGIPITIRTSGEVKPYITFGIDNLHFFDEDQCRIIGPKG